MIRHLATGIPQPPKPLGLPELLDRAFREYRRHFPFFATIAILCALPGVIADWIWTSDAAIGWTRLIVAPYALGLLFISATQVVIWNEASLPDVLRAALLRYFRFAGLVIAYILCAISLLLPPLGIWITVRWAMAAPALAAEPIDARAAIRRSTVLVRGAWWRCGFTIATVVVLCTIVAVILGLCAGTAVAFVPGVSGYVDLLLVGSAAILAGSLVVPIAAIAFSVLYVDLRVRSEGFDLDYLASTAEEAAQAA